MYTPPHSSDYFCQPSAAYRLNVAMYQATPRAAYALNSTPQAYAPQLDQNSTIADAYEKSMEPANRAVPSCISHDALLIDPKQFFLREVRPEQQFVSCTDQITDLVKDIFFRLYSLPFPNNVLIRVCSPEQMKQAYAQFGLWHSSIAGFSINRSPWVSEVFILQDELDRILLTIGHELGHVATPPLPNSIDEEAKAFAFSMTWVQTIVENNLLGLSASFQINPTVNGLHDVAWAWVKKGLHQGTTGRELFKSLIDKEKAVKEEF